MSSKKKAPRKKKAPARKKKVQAVAAPPEPSIDEILAGRPDLQQYLQIPELHDILRRGVKENWAPDRFYSELVTTKWYKTTNSQQRRWLTLTPREQEDAVREVKVKARQLAGITWWIPMDEAQVDNWGQRIASGQETETSFEAFLQEQAGHWFPAFRERFKGGLRPEQLFGPYLSTAAEELDQAPEVLAGSHRIFSQLITAGSTGELPNGKDFLKHIRSLPEWKNTRKAEQIASDWAERLISGVFQS